MVFAALAGDAQMVVGNATKLGHWLDVPTDVDASSSCSCGGTKATWGMYVFPIVRKSGQIR